MSRWKLKFPLHWVDVFHFSGVFKASYDEMKMWGAMNKPKCSERVSNRQRYIRSMSQCMITFSTVIKDLQ